MKQVSKKALSIILSFAIILTVFVPAISVYAGAEDMTAKAEETIAEYKAALEAIEKAGATRQWRITAGTPGSVTNTSPKSADPDSTSSTAYTLTLQDDSEGSLIYKAAIAFEKLLDPDNSVVQYGVTNVADQYEANKLANGEESTDLDNYPFPWTWWSILYYVLGDYMGLSNDLRAIHCAFTRMHYPNTQNWATKAMERGFSKDGKWRGSIGANKANANVTVNRSEISALRELADLDALLATPDSGVVTQIKYGVNGGVAAYEGKTAQRYHYFDTRQATTAASSNTLTNALKAYYAWFFENDLVDANPWAMGSTEIADTVAQNNAIAGAVASVPTDLMERFFADYSKVAPFMAECASANSLGYYGQDVAYFQDAGGFNETVTNGTAYDAENLEEMTALRAVEKLHYDRLKGLSAAGKQVVTDTFSLDMDAIEAANSKLMHDIQVIQLADSRAVIDAEVYDVYFKEDGDYSTYSSSKLANIHARMEPFVNEILNAETSAVAEVFGGDELRYIAFMAAIKYEADKRAPVNVAENTYRSFFEPILSSDLASKNSKELMSMLTQAKQKKGTFAADYAKAAAALTQEDLDLYYGVNYEERIDQAIAILESTLVARFNEEVAIAKALYNGAEKVTWDNVAEIGRMVGILDNDTYEYLNGLGVLSNEVKADYLWLKSTIYDEYLAFIADGGFANYEQSMLDGTYPVREPMATDLARHDDEDYAVTDDLLQDTLDKLDAFLVGTDFEALTGINISETITGLLGGIYSDATVNALVEILYPTVLSAFEDLWGELPSRVEDAGGAIEANLVITSLHDCLASDAGTDTMNQMALYPDLLANLLPDEFQKAKDQLNAAAEGVDWNTYPTNAWNSKEIRDVSSDKYGDEVVGSLNIDWGVDNPEGAFADLEKEERFMQAVSASLEGLYPLLASILLGQTFSAHKNTVASMTGTAFAYMSLCCNVKASISSDIYLDLVVEEGNDGYARLLTPIFEALLGPDNDDVIPTVADLRAITDARGLVDAIFNPINAFLAQLAEAPLHTVVDMLPNIAYAFSTDRILPLLSTLELNLKYTPEGDIKASGQSQGSLADNGVDMSGEVALNVGDMLLGSDSGIDLSFLSDMSKLLSMVTGLLGIDATLPQLDVGTLATLGQLQGPLDTNRYSGDRYYIDADQPDVFLFVMRYLLSAVKEPSVREALTGLLGEDNIIADILKNASDNPEYAIAAIVELVNPTASGTYDMDTINWLFTDETSRTTTYTKIWKKTDTQFVLDNLPNFIDDVIRLLGIYDDNGELVSIEGLLAGALEGIYTNATLNSIGLMVKDLLGSLDLDQGIKDLLAAQIGVDLGSWDFITEDYDWGFEDGDRDGFVAGVVTLLKPAYPLLKFLLTEEDISLFDGTVGASGYAGYAYGVIPLLEALGAKNILTPDQYLAAAAADSDEMVTAILNPILDVLDEIAADPLNVLLQRLPGLLYFIHSDGLSASVNNILHALNVLLDTIRPLYPVGALLDVNLDLYGTLELIMGLANDALGTNFKVPHDRNTLEKLLVGNIVQFQSLNGDTAYTLESDGVDFLTELLRFGVEFLYYQENRNAIIEMLAGVFGLSGDITKQIDAIFKSMRELFLAHNGADYVLQALLSTFKVVGCFVDTSLNLLDCINKNWVEILDKMKDCGVECVSEFATWLEKFLDENFNGIIDGGGVASEGLIKFFQGIVAWLQRIWEWLINFIKNFFTGQWDKLFA